MTLGLAIFILLETILVIIGIATIIELKKDKEDK